MSFDFSSFDAGQVLGLLILGMGIVTLLGSTFTIIRGWGTWSWQPTPGYITLASVREHHGGSEGDYITYYVALAYTYSVKGKAYSQDTVRMGGEQRYRNRRDAERQQERILRKSAIAVYYNPRKPQQATLARGVNWANTAPYLLVGTLFVSFSSYFLGVRCDDIPGLCLITDEVSRMVSNFASE